MERNGRPRRREGPSLAPSTITEIARRYYACAIALAKAMGLPLTETFLQAHRESISCCFIESGRAGVRLPTAVMLPPLVPVGPPAPEPNHDPLPAGAGEVDDTKTISTDHAMVLVTDSTSQAPPPSIIPAHFPSAGVRISDLKPGVLPMLIAKTAALVHAEGAAWVPLLGALQAERAMRLARGRRRDREEVSGQG